MGKWTLKFVFGLCVFLKRYLVDVERHDKPLADWRAEFLVGLHEVAGVLSHVPDVEHIVQAAVLIGDHVEHHVSVLLIGVNVVENHQGVPVVTSGYCLSRLPVDDVEQRLGWKGSVQSFVMANSQMSNFQSNFYGIVINCCLKGIKWHHCSVNRE